jgi:predicted acetyltransferase
MLTVPIALSPLHRADDNASGSAMTSEIVLRACTAEDWPAFANALLAGFGNDMPIEARENWATLVDPARMLVATDREAIVGTAGAVAFDMTVPGGELPTAAITMVTVSPTHRRRGILRQMMRRFFDDFHARGEAVTILWASEAAIYQRFGYGIGSFRARIGVDRGRAAFLGGAETLGQFRLITHAEACELLPPLHERVRRTIPGGIRRTPFWWDTRRLADFEWVRHGGSPLFRLALEVDGQLAGYALYRVHPGWSDVGQRTTWLNAIEVLAETPAATRALWQYLFSVDLVMQVRTYTLNHDHMLLLSLEDPRALQLRLADGLWIRVVDVERALPARTYGTADTLTFELQDPFCPWNGGVWQLDAGPDGASIRRVTTAPELRLSASELSAMYLGGVACTSLWRAGRVEELTPKAAHRADLLFRSDVSPWCLDDF